MTTTEAALESIADDHDSYTDLGHHTRSPWWTWPATRPGLLLAGAILLVALLWITIPGWFTEFDPTSAVTADKTVPPGIDHLFGTDYLGRDVFSRVVYGTASSARATIMAVLIGCGTGILAGTISGYLGGTVDDVIMRLADIVFAIPGLLLSLALVMVLGFGWLNIAIAVGAASVAPFTRLTRGEVLRARSSVSVESAHASGVGAIGVISRHVIPQTVGPVLALAVLEFGSALLAVSSLSFLGFGSPPPSPEWGALVASGRDYLADGWWMSILPGAVIVAVVLSVGRVGREFGPRGAR